MLALRAARGSGPGCAAFDSLRALRSSELQGRDEEQAFPVRTRNLDKEEGQRLHYDNDLTIRRVERPEERGLARGSVWPVSRPVFNDPASIEIIIEAHDRREAAGLNVLLSPLGERQRGGLNRFLIPQWYNFS